jgi:hypothetical protein
MEKNIKIRITSEYYNDRYIMINKDQLNLLDWLGEHGFLNISYTEENDIEYKII